MYYPWNLVPETVWTCKGALLTISIFIPTMAMILLTEVTNQIYAYIPPIYHIVEPFFIKLGEETLLDKRNHPYLHHMIITNVIMGIMFLAVLYRVCKEGFEVKIFLLYHFIRLGPRFRFFAHHHVLIHKEGHDRKRFFKGKYVWLNNINGFLAGIIYGSLPLHYVTAHNKIHHKWHNDVGDVHTNIDLDRTKLISFVQFIPRFFYYWSGISPLVIFVYKREWYLTGKLMLGMTWFYGIGLLLWKINPIFCMAYWAYPFLESMSFLGAIAYLWHSFVEESDPNNQYVNSITILNGKDNIFNEDYHVIHHHHPEIHWTEIKSYFNKTIDQYRLNRATIFRDTEQGELLYFLFTNNYDKMAEHYVDLTNEMSKEEIKQMLIKRLKYHK